MSSVSNFEFIFKSLAKESSKFNLETQNYKIYDRILLVDDIFAFYSYLELHINDHTGTLTDYLISAEGLEFETKFGFEENQVGYGGYLEANYIWDTNQLLDLRDENYLSGTMNVILHSEAYKSDSIRTRAWKDTKISAIVIDILENELNSDAEQFISTTGDTPSSKNPQNWHMINTTCEEYLEDLSEIAYNQSYQYSPFLTFFNSANEFYFMTIEELFKQAPIVDIKSPYTLHFGEETQYDPYKIKTIENVTIVGSEVNKENYKRRVYKNKSTGVPEKEDLNLKNYIIKDGGNILVRKDLVDSYDYTDIEDFGIYQANIDKEFYKGWKNSQFRDSALNLRMDILIAYNPKAISGKIIPLKISSEVEGKAGENKEFSGNWLIIGSTHFADPEGIPYTHLLLAKSSIQLDSEHPFKNDLI